MQKCPKKAKTCFFGHIIIAILERKARKREITSIAGVQISAPAALPSAPTLLLLLLEIWSPPPPLRSLLHFPSSSSEWESRLLGYDRAARLGCLWNPDHEYHIWCAALLNCFISPRTRLLGGSRLPYLTPPQPHVEY